MTSLGAGEGNEERWISDSKELLKGGPKKKVLKPFCKLWSALEVSCLTWQASPSVLLLGDIRDQGILWGECGGWETVGSKELHLLGSPAVTAEAGEIGASLGA